MAASAQKSINEALQKLTFFEDASFLAAPSSLSPDPQIQTQLAEHVPSWKRPGQMAKGARLFKNDWETDAPRLGALQEDSTDNHWYLGALNILAGDRDALNRLFFASHPERGLHALRFFVDDPNSDDDWQVVLIDDQLPCDGAGKLLFAQSAEPEVFWAAVVEKALAKLLGGYLALESPLSADATIRALEIFTGGKAEEVPLPQRGGEGEAVWARIMEAHRSGFVIGARIDSTQIVPAAQAKGLGLVPDRAYALVTSGEMVCGRMMRLRGFADDPEWTGKWSDKSEAWTSQLRNMLHYSNANDGTFWMAYEDFIKYFSELYFVRMADDRWSRLSVRSCWNDASAGGGPGYSSWRHNYQWLLRISRPSTKITIELSVAAANASEPQRFAIGFLLVRGNSGGDGERRKLTTEEGDAVAHCEARVARRVSLQIALEPSETPYVLIPYTSSPGIESRFQLTLLSDDRDDDGALDFGFSPVRKASDWFTSRVTASWSQASSPPEAEGFAHNLQVRLKLDETAPSGRVFVFVETLGVSHDMRAIEGLQEAPAYPSIGLALFEGCAPFGAPSRLEQPQARDGVWFEAQLAAGGAVHTIVPFLAAGEAAKLAGERALKLQLTIYSDVPHNRDEEKPGWSCRLGKAACKRCPYKHVVEKMAAIEDIMDKRISFLDGVLGK